MARRRRRRLILTPTRVLTRKKPYYVRTRGYLVKTTGWRDIPTITSRRLPTLLATIPEKRTYTPTPRMTYTIGGKPYTGVKAVKQHQLAFRQPKTLSICVRRSIRRQVMFASGRGGTRGLGRKKKRRVNEDSKISCKS